MAKTRKAMKVKQPIVDEPNEKGEESSDVFEVEKILDKRDSSKGLEYYVKWKGYPSTSNTWEPSGHILQQRLIKDFDKRQTALLKKKSKKAPPPPPSEEVEEEEEEEGEEEEEELEGEADAEVEEEEVEEPVKAKRARTASKSSRASVAKPKAGLKSKKSVKPEPSKVPIKIKTNRRAAESKNQPEAEPVVGKATAQPKTKTAAAVESKKAPNRRNVPVKRAAPAGNKNSSLQEPEEDKVPDRGNVASEQAPKSSDTGARTEALNETVIVSKQLEFDKLKITRLIDESVTKKMVTLLGIYDGADAVIRLEKTIFDEDAVKAAFKNKDTVFERDFVNDIYSNYKMSPNESSSLNGIKATVVYPANELVLAKYARDESILFSETADVYLKIVQPYIDSVLSNKNDPNRWLYNILEGKSEVERVIMNDDDPDSGFMIVPDLKWSGDEKDLHLVAICHRRDLRSLRDLTDKHMTLLKNILTKGTQAVKDKFPNLKGQIRSYIHYQPSFYHFHVHFRVVDASDPQSSDRDNLLGTVINNISLKKDYYKKTSLVYPLSLSHPLYRELEKANRI